VKEEGLDVEGVEGPHQYEAKFLGNIVGRGNSSKVTSQAKKNGHKK
jgi:hypothetical protein